jgi:N-acyl-D-amino-acid deacylase
MVSRRHRDHGDRIRAMGSLGNATARTVIDAGDRYVTPGFIDVHSHAGPGWRPRS